MFAPRLSTQAFVPLVVTSGCNLRQAMAATFPSFALDANLRAARSGRKAFRGYRGPPASGSLPAFHGALHPALLATQAFAHGDRRMTGSGARPRVALDARESESGSLWNQGRSRNRVRSK